MDFLKNAVDHCRNMEEVNASTKNIKYVFGTDGVYEIRKNELGTFTVKADKVIGADNVKEGFSLDIPLIPFHMFSQIYSFFKDICDDSSDEVMLQVFFDKTKEEYFLHCPVQTISGTNIVFERDKELYENDNTLLVLDIHSHNTMSAFFSKTDDSSEKETRIYGVIGRLNYHTPEVKFRVSVGGSFRTINVYNVFEKDESCNLLSTSFIVPKADYPSDWASKLTKVQRTVSSNITSNYSSWGNSRRNNYYRPSTFWWSKNEDDCLTHDSDGFEYATNFNNMTSHKPTKRYHIYDGTKSFSDLIDYFGKSCVTVSSGYFKVYTTEEQLKKFDPEFYFDYSIGQVERPLTVSTKALNETKQVEYDPSKDEYANLSFHERIAKMKEKKDKEKDEHKASIEKMKQLNKETRIKSMEEMIRITKELLKHSYDYSAYQYLSPDTGITEFLGKSILADNHKSLVKINKVLGEVYSLILDNPDSLDMIVSYLSVVYKEQMYPFYKAVIFDQYPDYEYGCKDFDDFVRNTPDEEFFIDTFIDGYGDAETFELISELSYPLEINIFFLNFYKHLIMSGYDDAETLKLMYEGSFDEYHPDVPDILDLDFPM